MVAAEQRSLCEVVDGIDQHAAPDGTACVDGTAPPGLKDGHGPVFIDRDADIETRDIVAVVDNAGNYTAVVDPGEIEEIEPRRGLIIERNIVIAKLLRLGRCGPKSKSERDDPTEPT